MLNFLADLTALLLQAVIQSFASVQQEKEPSGVFELEENVLFR